MRIDEKDIDKLLEEFEGEDIKIPETLDTRLNEKLKELKPKKKNRFVKSLIASVAILVLSYSVIPGFKTFADNVFKYIFGDIGIENAANHGYENIPSQTHNIYGHEVEIENIYIDNLRIVFDATIKANKEIKFDEFGTEEEQYSIGLIKEGSSEILNQCSWSVEYKGYDKKSNSFKSTVQIIAKNNKSFLDVKDGEIKQKIEVIRYYNAENEDDIRSREESIGTSEIIFNVPKYLNESKIIEINKYINTNRLNLEIKSLEISPTMMYLDTKGELDKDYPTEGLYNFKIISEDNTVYKDNMTLSATWDENGETRQTIVPSIYYDKSKRFKLKADGVLVAVKKDIKVDVNNKNNRNIDYLGSNVTIKDVFYKGGKLTVEIFKNNNISHAGIATLEGENVVEEYQHGDEIHGFVFETPQKDEYNIQLELIMKHKSPIEIDISK